MKIITKLSPFLYLLISLITTSCNNSNNKEETDMPDAADETNIYGTTSNGDTVRAYTLENSNGLQMEVISLGGIITSLKVPDREGNLEDIVLGFDSLSSYEADHPYFGALIGRFGNRIAKGKFTLDGTEYALPINNEPNSLHGGDKGFHTVHWNVEKLENKNGLKLTYTSKDMEMGYPGNLDVEVTYILSDSNALEITYKATTDKKTVVNLTQHSYFNLSGDMTSKILDHILMINADTYLPVDSTLIPAGGEQSVANTPFDFREPKEIGKEINEEDQQLEFGLGYDHCWVLNNKNDDLALAATVYHEESGRLMEVFTTEPGLQFYSGNFLDGSLTGKGGVKYQQRTGLCLETQHFPDSPNNDSFPSTILEPGDTYATKTTYKFSVK